MVTSVAVIGAGSLGAPIARRLHDLGYDLTVCDRNDAALQQFRELRVRTTSTPADCGGSDLIFLLVATPDQARTAVLGESGVVQGIPPGGRPLLAVVSTVSREVVVNLGSDSAARGLRTLDTPVSGGPPRALAGTLTVLVAGTEADIREAEPVLSGLGAVHQCGALGNAQSLKLINNIVCAANIAVTGEAYRLALECGLRLTDVSTVLDVSTGRNFMSDGAGTAETYLRDWTQSLDYFNSTLAIVRKDVDLAIEMAAEAPGAYVGLSGLASLLSALGDETFEDWSRAAAGNAPLTGE